MPEICPELFPIRFQQPKSSDHDIEYGKFGGDSRTVFKFQETQMINPQAEGNTGVGKAYGAEY
jgi:hypothetical protein